jgi:hypothetical protein
MCIANLVLMHYSQRRVIVNDDLENDGKSPAPLNLPFGKLFFGFNIPPYVPPPAPEDEQASKVRVPQITPLLVAHSHRASGCLPRGRELSQWTSRKYLYARYRQRQEQGHRRHTR